MLHWELLPTIGVRNSPKIALLHDSVRPQVAKLSRQRIAELKNTLPTVLRELDCQMFLTMQILNLHTWCKGSCIQQLSKASKSLIVMPLALFHPCSEKWHVRAVANRQCSVLDSDMYLTSSWGRVLRILSTSPSRRCSPPKSPLILGRTLINVDPMMSSSRSTLLAVALFEPHGTICALVGLTSA